MLQLINTARSTNELSTQASMYISMSNRPVRSPGYLALDAASPWHTSAMQATALESATLPSRLSAVDGQRKTLNEMEAALSNDGNRKIAKLAYSVADPEDLKDRTRSQSAQQHDLRTNKFSRSDEAGRRELEVLDIDLTADSSTAAHGRAARRKEHIFARAECLRGAWNAPDEFEGATLRTQSRFGEGPVVQR